MDLSQDCPADEGVALCPDIMNLVGKNHKTMINHDPSFQSFFVVTEMFRFFFKRRPPKNAAFGKGRMK